MRPRDFLDTQEQMDDVAVSSRIEACARRVGSRGLRVVAASSECFVVASEQKVLLP